MSKPILRILLIYPGYPPEEALGGGISTFAYELSQGIKTLGHHITVISRTEGLRMETTISDEVRVIRLPGERFIGRMLPPFAFRHWGVLSYSYRLRRLIQRLESTEGPFSIIESGDWGAEAFALLSRFSSRLLIRCHTPSFIAQDFNTLNPPYLSKFVGRLEQAVLARARYLAFPSEHFYNIIQSKVTLSGEIRIQTHPLQLNRIPAKTIYEKIFSSDDPLKVLIVGRLEERKGQDIAIRALNILHSRGYAVHFTFAGSDTPINNGHTFKEFLLKELDAELYSCVAFLNHVSRTNLLKLYQQYDVVAIPSRFENLAFSLLEAMSAGIPVVASQVGEMTSLISNGLSGLLIEPNDPEALAEALISFINDPNLIIRLGSYGRKTMIENMQKSLAIDKIVEYYADILGRNDKQF